MALAAGGARLLGPDEGGHVKIRIRKGHVGATGLVYDAWIKTVAEEAHLRRRSVDPGLRRAIDRVLAKPTTEVLVALEVDTGDIAGFVVVDPAAGVLHFAYTKPGKRRYGVARTLLGGQAWRCWLLTRYARHLAGLAFDPLALLEC